MVFLAQPDGTPTANVHEMDKLDREAWGINRKYAKGPELCLEAFLGKYGHLLHKVPMLANRLTGEYLWKQLWTMTPLAMGSDGRSLQGPWALPDRVLDRLALLVARVEEVGC